MPKMLSYWPPQRPPDAPETSVRSRHVLYVPGYDPDADKRTRMLFVREFQRYARRFGLTAHAVSPSARAPDDLSLSWTVRAAAAGWATDTTIEVLRWDDIVRADFAKPLPVRAALLLVGLLHSVVTGVMATFFRLSWKFGGVILFPAVMVLLLVACAGLAAGAGAALVRHAVPAAAGDWRIVVEIVVAGILFWGVAQAARPLFERWFVWHLMHDWVFNWQHGNGWRPDYDARVDVFAGRLVELARSTSADEILVLGHSSGSIMALEIVTRALEREPRIGRLRARLALLTVGSCIPIVVLNARARRAREGIRRIVASEQVLWVEYQAPQDWMNFSGFNAALDIGSGGTDIWNPVIRSARFADIVAPATYAAILYRPFRIHFQFLMANDMPGEYDVFALTCGPLPLARRCLGEEASWAQAAAGAETSIDGSTPEDEALSDAAVMQRRIAADI